MNSDEALIFRFLNGELSADELAEFRERTVKDEAFAQQLSAASASVKADYDLKQRLRNIGEDYEQESPTKRPLPWKLIGIAASLALVIAFTFLFNQSDSSRGEALFAEQFEPYSDWPYTRSLESSTSWEAAVRHYKEGNYEKTIQELKQVEDDEFGNPPLYHLCLGISYLSLSEPDAESAVVFLEKAQSSGSVFTPAASWYLSLAQIRRENLETASEILQSLSNSQDETYSRKATQLLAELEE